MANSNARSEDFHYAAQALAITARAMTVAEIGLGREMAYQCQTQNYMNCN